jgi:hypothetical protein
MEMPEMTATALDRMLSPALQHRLGVRSAGQPHR